MWDNTVHEACIARLVDSARVTVTRDGESKRADHYDEDDNDNNDCCWSWGGGDVEHNVTLIPAGVC